MKRKTKETKVEVSINLDGTGVCSSNSQIPFLDHMMDVSVIPSCLINKTVILNVHISILRCQAGLRFLAGSLSLSDQV